ncbi:hypothetical protein H9P43_008352 [Blastocladiella emersonii ATCC 22665]|nr:hypothetical protein H9P43_008352 [Blastocladiella emersonii ATCC 22665]
MASVGRLEVFVGEAKGLKSMDFLAKNSPYVLLTCGTNQVKSTIKSNAGAAAKWDETLSIEVPEGVFCLSVSVYDKDLLTRDDRIGTADIMLHEVLRGVPLSDTFTLIDKKGRETGSATLRASFFSSGRHIEIPKFMAYPTGASSSFHGPLAYPSSSS